MKKFYLISFIVFLCSCTNTIDDINSVVDITDDSENFVEINFKSTLPEVIETPFTRASNSTNDLYGVEIEEITNSTPYVDGHYSYQVQTYACGFFNSLNDANITLIKNKKYAVKVIYVPDGKNKIKHNGNIYCNPFIQHGPNSSPVYGKYTYGGSANMDFAGFGASQAPSKSDYKIQTNMGNTIDIYYGGTIINVTENVEINVNLYRQMFKLNINVENLSNGTVSVVYGNDYNTVKNNDGYIYTATSSNSTINETIELSHMPWSIHEPREMNIDNNMVYVSPYSDELYSNWYFNDVLYFVYTNDSGKTLSLFNIEREFKRMTEYSISFNINDYIDESTGSLKTNVNNSSDWNVVEIIK